jgi:hypothetical protein
VPLQVFEKDNGLGKQEETEISKSYRSKIKHEIALNQLNPEWRSPFACAISVWINYFS